MDFASFSTDASRLVFGAFATFCAILLWSRTRDMAWTFVIIGVIVSYAGIVFSAMESFGILDSRMFLYNGIPLVKIALANIPVLFSGIGMLAAATRRRLP
jgi:ABC-type spermidine/putrescine transport system permease subunit II